MNAVIYQSLIIYIFVFICGIDPREVRLDNTTGVLGADGIKLKCSFIINENDFLAGVTFEAKNDSNSFEQIAESIFSKEPKLLPYGEYLFGDANISKILPTSTETVLTFDDLQCKHDRIYRCKLSIAGHNLIFSEKNQLSVTVPPSKPERILLVHTPVDSSLSTTKLMEYSSLSPSNTVTSKQKQTFSTLQTVKLNDTSFNNSEHITIDHNTTSSTSLNGDVSSDSTYDATTYSTVQTTTKQGIAEGDNLTVVCTGDVGKPPAEHVFQKYRSGQIVPIQDPVITTSISEMSENCSFNRTSNLTFEVKAADDNAMIRCFVKSSMEDQDMYIETAPLEVYYDIPTTQSSSTCSSSCVDKKEEKSKGNLDDIPTTQSSSTCSSSCVDKKEEKSKGNWVQVVVIVLSVVVVIVFPIIIIAWRKNARKSTTDTNESKGFVEPKSKLIAVSRTGDYDDIALEEDTNKTQTVKNVPEVEDNKKHNEEYFKRQEEEEQEIKKSNTPPEPAVYAEVNEATKSKNKLKTESTENADTQEEDTYAESQEGIYDRAGNRRHIENENTEQFDSSTNSSKQNGNDDTKLSIQNSQLGSYANQGLEKDDIRKVATVSPTVRSSSGSQNDEQKISNRNNQSKQGYENIIGTEQTGISGEDSSHRTAL